MPRSFIFSSESVGEGHPDKVCDTISDAILDACLTIDPKSRVACETFAKSNIVVVGGEITIPKIGQKPIGEVINVEKVIRDAVRGIGYVHDDDVFHADRLFINNYLTTQSPDIAQGVDNKKAKRLLALSFPPLKDGGPIEACNVNGTRVYTVCVSAVERRRPH